MRLGGRIPPPPPRDTCMAKGAFGCGADRTSHPTGNCLEVQCTTDVQSGVSPSPSGAVSQFPTLVAVGTPGLCLVFGLRDGPGGGRGV